MHKQQDRSEVRMGDGPTTPVERRWTPAGRFVFPGPGELSTSIGQVVADVDAVMLLGAAALYDAGRECRDPGCPGCNDFRTAWWNVCNGLPRTLRIRLQQQLTELFGRLPEGPYEEVEQ